MNWCGISQPSTVGRQHGKNQKPALVNRFHSCMEWHQTMHSSKFVGGWTSIHSTNYKLFTRGTGFWHISTSERWKPLDRDAPCPATEWDRPPHPPVVFWCIKISTPSSQDCEAELRNWWLCLVPIFLQLCYLYRSIVRFTVFPSATQMFFFGRRLLRSWSTSSTSNKARR